MLKIKFFCRICVSTKDTFIRDRVPQKIDMFFAECDKGHIFEVYIPKQMMKLLKEPKTVKPCPECGGEMEKKKNSVSVLANEHSSIIKANIYWECKKCFYKQGGES